MEDEIRRPASHELSPPDLQSWNIADLQSYRASLLTEIARVDAKISEKEKINDAAAALFKSS